MSKMSKEHDVKLRELCDDLKRWQGYYDPVDDKGQHEMFVSAADAATELLALRKERERAVPVAYMIGGHYLMHANDPKVDNYSSAVPLYTAPPAPVAVPNELVSELLDIAKRAAEEADECANAEFSDNSMKHAREIAEWERRAAMLAAPGKQQLSVETLANVIRNAPLAPSDNQGRQREPMDVDCWCRTCRPVSIGDMRFVVCPDCGNKRCPKANDHRNSCTGSNDPGQDGSEYPAAPGKEG